MLYLNTEYMMTSKVNDIMQEPRLDWEMEEDWKETYQRYMQQNDTQHFSDK